MSGGVIAVAENELEFISLNELSAIIIDKYRNCEICSQKALYVLSKLVVAELDCSVTCHICDLDFFVSHWEQHVFSIHSAHLSNYFKENVLTNSINSQNDMLPMIKIEEETYENNSPIKTVNSSSEKPSSELSNYSNNDNEDVYKEMDVDMRDHKDYEVNSDDSLKIDSAVFLEILQKTFRKHIKDENDDNAIKDKNNSYNDEDINDNNYNDENIDDNNYNDEDIDNNSYNEDIDDNNYNNVKDNDVNNYNQNTGNSKENVKDNNNANCKCICSCNKNNNNNDQIRRNINDHSEDTLKTNESSSSNLPNDYECVVFGCSFCV